MKVDKDYNITRTKREAENLHYVSEALQRVEHDLHTHLMHLRRIP